jgi:tetratricopeptide (TPR) repeat protein
MRETDKAIMFLNQAQQSAEAIETDLAKSYVMDEIAITAAKIGEIDEALALFDRVLQIAKTMTSPQFLDNAHAQKRVVASFAAISLASQDTVLLNRACQIAEMMINGEAKAFAFKIVASTYLKFGKTDKASKFLEKAGKIIEMLSDDALLSTFAAFAANMADSTKDTSFLDKAYIFTDAITSEYWKVSALRAIAVSWANLGKLDLAVDLLEQARLMSEAIAGSITSENTRALALSELAESAVLLGDSTEVAKFLESCRQSATQIYDDSYRVRALTAIATSAAKIGNWNQALDIANSNALITSKAESMSAILRVWSEYLAFDKKKDRRDTKPMRDLQTHKKASTEDTAKVVHRNILQYERKSYSKNVRRVFLRSNPLILSEEEVTSMIKQRGFFEVERNKEGRGLQHQYEEVTRQGEKLIIDHTTHLTWQKFSSEKNFKFARAQEYIRELNTQKYAGYNDWRLPTLEEAMSLMEPQKSYMYINSLFFDTYSIWTADTYPYSPSAAEWGWYVEFSKGLAVGDIGFSYPVRAVR